jgi:HEPN domain-containing protein
MRGSEARDRQREAEAWLAVADADRLKGFLILAGIRFRRTHDLGELADEAIASFSYLAGMVEAARSWTPWGVAYRYPSPEGQSDPEPDETSLRAALVGIDALADRPRAAIQAG